MTRKIARRISGGEEHVAQCRAGSQALCFLVVCLACFGNAQAEGVAPPPPVDVTGMMALRSFYFAEARDTLQRRTAFDQMMASQPLPTGTEVRPVIAGDVPAEMVRAKVNGASRGRRAVLYLHGGGFYSGSAATHRALAGALARFARADVLVIDYRRTPEHVFPAALDDAASSYNWLLSHGYRADRIAIAGESVGGNLAIELALRIRDTGQPLPAAVIAMSPATDLEATGQSMWDNAARDPVIQRAGVQGVAKAYLADTDPKDPRASPLQADLRGLPPILLQVGSTEVLLDDAVRMARKAALQDVAVSLQVWPRMIHQWQLFPVSSPEAAAALRAVAEFATARMK